MLSARHFLEGMIDYAGLFPPASLGMEEAVHAYSEYRSGADRELLGRFVVPASRLREFARALEGSALYSDEVWPVSVIAGSDFGDAQRRSREFNASNPGRAFCDSIETVADGSRAVKSILEESGDEFDLFLEVPLSSNPATTIAAMSGTRAAAKIRTGGVTSEAIPSSDAVLRFMSECHRHSVPFKATAGLHHAVRSHYPLTYETDAEKGLMFGYLNIFLGAAALEAGWDEAEVRLVLDQQDRSCFDFDSDGAVVNGRRLTNEQLIEARQRFARSFGSCSFTEPVAEARELGLV